MSYSKGIKYKKDRALVKLKGGQWCVYDKNTKNKGEHYMNTRSLHTQYTRVDMNSFWYKKDMEYQLPIEFLTA